MSVLIDSARLIGAAIIALTLTGAAAAGQQLDKSQVVQFLTAKKHTTSDGNSSIWKADGTYQLSGRRGRVNGRYSIGNDGQVCWKADNRATGCFIVVKDDKGYYGQNNRSTWRYR